MPEPRLWTINLSDLLPRYEAVVDALRGRYGAEAAALLEPVDLKRLERFEAQLAQRLEEWQWIVRARALGVLTYVAVKAIDDKFSPGTEPLQPTDEMHACGIEAQWRFLKEAAQGAGLSDAFGIADVRARWFELVRRPLPVSLVQEARRFAAATGGTPKYGPLRHYVWDRWRFYVPKGRLAAVEIIDDLEMCLLKHVLVRPGGQRIQIQTH